MLNQLKLFFDQHIVLSEPDKLSKDDLNLACASIFIEMSYIDDNVETVEQEMILNRVQDLFDLSLDHANTLISLAATQREQATDYFQFTSLINKGFSPEQKIKIIKILWQIAYADGHLDDHEEHLVRKIARLLHVPHIDFIKTKIQASGE